MLLVHEDGIAGGRPQRRLGGAVGNTGSLVDCAHGGNVDDVPPLLTLGDEGLYRLTHGIDGAVGVHPKQLVEHLIRDVAYRGVVIHNAGVVHQHIQAAKFLHCQVDHPHAGLRISHIALTGDYPTGGILQGCRQLLQSIQPPGYGDDIGPLLSESFHDGMTHTGGRAGHDDGFVLKTHVLFLLTTSASR